MKLGERKKRSSCGTAVLSFFLILVLAACGGGSSYNASDQKAEPKSNYEGEAYAEDYAAAEAVYDTADAAGGGEEGKSTKEENGGEETGTEAAESKQKLVYTCSMEIQTLTFSETAKKVHEVIRQYDGIIESESTTDSDYEWYKDDSAKRRGTLSSYLVIRIPTEKYEDFLASLEGTGGKITNRSMDVQNITRVYNDQTVYIESLEKQEARLLQMMEQAQTIEEMITVEDRLTDVQTELNQARSRLAGMDTDVAYSTVSLSLTEVVKYTENPVKKKNFFERTRVVFSGSVSAFLDVMEMLLDVVIYLLPYAVLVGAVIGSILFATRKKRAERRKEREEMKRQMQARNPYGFGGGIQPNGPQLNGPQMNGPQMNGPQMNGPQMNGPQPNGPQMNGPQPNGPQPNGPQMNGPQPNGPQPNGPQPNGPKMNDQQAADSRVGGSREGFSAETDSEKHMSPQNTEEERIFDSKDSGSDKLSGSPEDTSADAEPSVREDVQPEDKKNDTH